MPVSSSTTYIALIREQALDLMHYTSRHLDHKSSPSGNDGNIQSVVSCHPKCTCCEKKRNAIFNQDKPKLKKKETPAPNPFPKQKKTNKKRNQITMIVITLLHPAPPCLVSYTSQPRQPNSTFPPSTQANTKPGQTQFFLC